MGIPEIMPSLVVVVLPAMLFIAVVEAGTLIGVFEVAGVGARGLAIAACLSLTPLMLMTLYAGQQAHLEGVVDFVLFTAVPPAIGGLLAREMVKRKHPIVAQLFFSTLAVLATFVAVGVLNWT